jgi:hypothetical protein
LELIGTGVRVRIFLGLAIKVGAAIVAAAVGEVVEQHLIQEIQQLSKIIVGAVAMAAWAVEGRAEVEHQGLTSSEEQVVQLEYAAHSSSSCSCRIAVSVVLVVMMITSLSAALLH